MKNETKKLAVTSMLVAAALILSYVESLIPSFSVPGVKLGLANIAVIFALYVCDGKTAAFVSLVRVFAVGVLFGSAASFIYSLAGATLSLALMMIARRSDVFSVVGVSLVGGVSHNIGQLIAAAFVMRTSGIMYYLPALLVSGAVTGALIGLTGGVLIGRLKEHLPEIR